MQAKMMHLKILEIEIPLCFSGCIDECFAHLQNLVEEISGVSTTTGHGGPGMPGDSSTTQANLEGDKLQNQFTPTSRDLVQEHDEWTHIDSCVMK